jgi:hypothetical protein
MLRVLELVGMINSALPSFLWTHGSKIAIVSQWQGIILGDNVSGTPVLRKAYIMKKLFLFLGALTLSINAIAQSSFSGLDLGVGFAIQGVGTGSGSQTNNGGAFEQFGSTNKTSANANFNIGYNWAVADRFILGLQASLQPITSGGTQVQKVPGTLTYFQNNSRYDFSFLPGLLLNSDTLLYGKIGYSFTKENVGNVDGAWNTNLNYSGYVAGVGIKSFGLGNLVGIQNLYGFAEYNHAGYGNQGYSVINTSGNSVVSSGIGLNSNTGLIGLGYIF